MRRACRALLAFAAVLSALTVVPTAGPAGAASGPSCGGQQAVRAANGALGGTWHCTFDDEVGGDTLDRSAWHVQTTAEAGFHSGSECMVDSPSTVAVGRGVLALRVRQVAPFVCPSRAGAYGTQYIGGSVYTRTFAQAYGRFDVRARFADGAGRQGLQSSVWLYPVRATSSLTSPTEIDIAENYSVYRDWVAPTVHNIFSFAPRTASCRVSSPDLSFHTYSAVWTPAQVTFRYDGRTCATIATGGPSTPFLVALTQALGIAWNASYWGTPLPASMDVDYVRVWG